MASSVTMRRSVISSGASAAPAQRRACIPRASVTAERASLETSKMVPMSDRVLIKPLEEEQRTQGGILLPKSAPKAPSDAHFGEVVALGTEVKLKLTPGQTVVFQKYAMAEVEIKDGNILFVAEKSILGVLE